MGVLNRRNPRDDKRILDPKEACTKLGLKKRDLKNFKLETNTKELCLFLSHFRPEHSLGFRKFLLSFRGNNFLKVLMKDNFSYEELLHEYDQIYAELDGIHVRRKWH